MADSVNCGKGSSSIIIIITLIIIKNVIIILIPFKNIINAGIIVTFDVYGI